jgi:hypothetical protein
MGDIRGPKQLLHCDLSEEEEEEEEDLDDH